MINSVGENLRLCPSKVMQMYIVPTVQIDSLPEMFYQFILLPTE